ncbi:MAG: beta strand repeat-containing protein, partial [Pseudomonas sp.]
MSDGRLNAMAGSGVSIVGASSGSSLVLQGSISDINTFIASSGVTFIGAPNATADVTLQVSINDQGNAGSGGAKSDTKTTTVHINAVNDAPVNHVPTTQTVDMNGTLVFNSGNSNLISISDVDAGSSLLKVTLTASRGTISLGGTSGLSFLTGSGNGDVIMSFQGSLNDINAALNGLTFTPTAGYYGSTTLTITTDDNGNTGSGGLMTDTDILLINVAPTFPQVTDVSAGNLDGNYKVGDTIDVTVTFNQNVLVDTSSGVPTLLLETGLVDRNAIYVSGSGSNTLTFRYTVQAGDSSSDLNYTSSSALALNGARISNASSLDAALTLPGLGDAHSLAAHKNLVVDGVTPKITSVGVPADGTYVAGQHLDFTVNLSENVTVDTTGGTPRLQITLDGGGTVFADYLSGSGSSALVFRLTVSSGQLDSNGISVGSSLVLNGGAVRDAAGNNVVASLNSVGSTTGVLVDAVAPNVSAPVAIDANPSNAGSVRYTVTFSETVSGVDASDFSLTFSGTANGGISSVTSLDGRTYT